jgi:hypothetical protein
MVLLSYIAFLQKVIEQDWERQKSAMDENHEYCCQWFPDGEPRCAVAQSTLDVKKTFGGQTLQKFGGREIVDSRLMTVEGVDAMVKSAAKKGKRSVDRLRIADQARNAVTPVLAVRKAAVHGVLQSFV